MTSAVFPALRLIAPHLNVVGGPLLVTVKENFFHIVRWGQVASGTATLGHGIVVFPTFFAVPGSIEEGPVVRTQKLPRIAGLRIYATQ